MLKYLRVIFLCAPSIIWNHFVYTLKYYRHPEKYPLEERFKRIQKLIRKVLKAFHVNYNLIDAEEVFNKNKEDSKLIICNHISDLDPLIMIALSEKPVTFAAKIELERFPFIGKIIKAIDGVFLDREDLKQQLRVMKTIEEKLKTTPNLDWVIFPEGTRNKTLDEIDVLPFHHGTFRPAFKSQKHIIYSAIYGSQRVLEFKSKKKYEIYYKFLKDNSYEDYSNKTTSEIALEAQEMVEKAVKELKEVAKKSNV